MIATAPMRDVRDIPSAPTIVKRNRVQSIDLLRGIVMVIMALDHVRDYFHRDAFLFSPTDLAQTTPVLFFTRFVTHYCAPVFVFLAGLAACLYGNNKSKKQLQRYLFTRGAWLVLVEIFIISFALTFNPTYPVFSLQVIWAIGICMMVMSAIIYLKRPAILVLGLLLVGAHNMLDSVSIPGDGWFSVGWSFLHVPKQFIAGRFNIFFHYPVLPWIGIMALGYYVGSWYHRSFDQVKRRRLLFITGVTSILLFCFLRAFNIYGDAARWSVQRESLYSFLSFLNVTKYPPSLLYALVTLGPAMIFLSLAERPLNPVTSILAVFGRVPFFYYVLHLFMIHLLALVAAPLGGYHWSDMILNNRVNSSPELKGYGYSLAIVYLVWASLVLLLYPCCKWFEQFKSRHQREMRWLRYV